ncbi:hypothetical protein MPER_11193 [Moniliophthora perniciosa FA553]|nr:hypothetical protein MPER_11193 [Moniliophthora perniciosa FA553]
MRTRSEESLPDPYLIARYQTPLPLPPGARTPFLPTTHTHPHHLDPLVLFRRHPYHHTEHRDQQVLPPKPPSPPAPKHMPFLPVPAQSPVARQATPISEDRLRLLREAEERAARRREQEERDAELARQLFESEQEQAEAPPPPPSKPKESPEEIARRLEAEAERIRKEQEEKDLELARQLDRELNLDEDDDAPRGRMPGVKYTSHKVVALHYKKIHISEKRNPDSNMYIQYLTFCNIGFEKESWNSLKI